MAAFFDFLCFIIQVVQSHPVTVPNIIIFFIICKTDRCWS